jgi:hypothetical protein
MSDGLFRPKAGRTDNLNTRRMEDGIFRNPPTYTALGGFTSEQKWTDPAGRRYAIGGPSLERGGPSSQKGKPI